MRAWTRALVRGGQMLTVEQTGFADGLGVGSEKKEKAQEGKDVCIIMADSHFMAETIITL